MSSSNFWSYFSTHATLVAVWGLLLGLLVTGLAALVQCRVVWLHRWLRLGWISDLLLSKDPRQKMLCIRFLVGWVNCAVGVAALNFGVSIGVIDADQTRYLTIAALLVQGVWYAAIRSGWNKQFNDPSMAEAMRATVVGFLAWGYLIGGPGRPVALMLLFMMLMFGMFVSTSGQLIRTCVLAALMFGAVMLHIAQTESGIAYQAEMQMVYFGVMLTMLVSVCLLVNQLARMRSKSTQRKNDLSLALSQVQELAIRDELTGLFNRRHMGNLMQAEKLRADRARRGFALCLIDVDHFKRVNDSHGHAVGDEVLARLAQSLQDELRDTDAIARWGGEEFLVMFTDTDDEAPHAVLERIRKHLAQTVVSTMQPDVRVTFSAGLTAYRFGEELHDTLERADVALYQAKAEGRNRTVKAPSGLMLTKASPASPSAGTPAGASAHNSMA
jgi:diguanylate cyclase